MRKLLLATLFISYVKFSEAQNLNIANTLTRVDSAIADELKDNLLDNMPVISLDDNDLTDAVHKIFSSLLTAGRDPFFNAASFNFSALRFRMRGYNGDARDVYQWINYGRSE
jgi:hypothetical protein